MPLAPLTTFKVGGPADWLIDRTRDELPDALAIARALTACRSTVLGGGSNVLVADAGVRGLVVRLHGGDVARDSPLTAIRADAASRSTAWCAGRSTTASPASKPGPARRARSAAQSSATRISAAG